MQINYFIAITGSMLLIVFSWLTSLRHKRNHGIPRFLSFESIFILLILNIKVWFKDPLSFHQILSWISLIFSAYAALAGFLILKIKGNPVKNFENTTVLVSSGLYGYIRHPLYLSLFLLGTGIMLKNPEPLQLFLSAVNLLAVYFTSRVEEKEMVKKFGAAYIEYMKGTKMFVPYLI